MDTPFEKIHFMAKEGSAEAQAACDEYKAEYGQTSIENAGAIVSFGGDGTVLEAIRTVAIPYGKPLFPINVGGTIGFLANKRKKSDLKKLLERIAKADEYTQHPLWFEAEFADGTKKTGIAVNDVYIHGGKREVKLMVTRTPTTKINKHRVLYIAGDGLIISTPLGSTAYTWKAKGQVKGLDSEKTSITPICAIGMEPEALKMTMIEIEAPETGHKGVLSADGKEIGENLVKLKVGVSPISYKIRLEPQTVSRRKRMAKFHKQQLKKLFTKTL